MSIAFRRRLKRLEGSHGDGGGIQMLVKLLDAGPQETLAEREAWIAAMEIEEAAGTITELDLVFLHAERRVRAVRFQS